MVQHCLGQSSTPTAYTDPDTGITFDTWSTTGMKWGFTFPSDGATTDATEFIGYLVRCTGCPVYAFLTSYLSNARLQTAKQLAGVVCHWVVP